MLIRVVNCENLCDRSLFQDRKLKDNRAWFLDTVSQFKPPAQQSREALDSPRVKIGPHELSIQPKLKDTALRISSILVKFFNIILIIWLPISCDIQVLVGLVDTVILVCNMTCILVSV